jgi:L-cystine uptake protein TcyP (sodium:dicarboxylate symporter family)
MAQWRNILCLSLSLSLSLSLTDELTHLPLFRLTTIRTYVRTQTNKYKQTKQTNNREFGDVNSTFQMNDGGNTVVDMSLSDTIYEGVFLTLIPENIFQEFYNANYAAIIVFAIAMGVACAKVLNRQQIHSSDMTFMSLLVDLDQILTIMIIWIIMLTPFGKLQLLLYYYDALSYIYIYIYIYTI